MRLRVVVRLTTKRAKGHHQVFTHKQGFTHCFANLYRVGKGWAKGKIKEGEWVINRGPAAISGGWFFPPVSYPTMKEALKEIGEALRRAGYTPRA